MSPEKMVHMANQIATFFKTQPGGDTPEKIANHLSDFWEPRMRAQLFDLYARGGDGLDALVIEARDKIRPVKQSA